MLHHPGHELTSGADSDQRLQHAPQSSPLQQQQVQSSHVQLPVSQQPQHAHASQPAEAPTLSSPIAGANASAAQRRNMDMRKPFSE
jgi:hypothetical protein